MNGIVKRKESKFRCKYPLIDPTDMVFMLTELDIKCSKEEITKPQPAPIISLYETFLHMLVGEDAGNEGTSYQVLDILEFPDLHTDSLALMSFYRKL